jgi:hypothetical protein
MFEHLDDPNPPPVGNEARAAVARRQARRVRRRRVGYAVVSAAAVVAASASVALNVSGGHGTAVNVVRGGPRSTTAVTTTIPATTAPPTTTPVTTSTTTTVLQAPLTVTCAALAPAGGPGTVEATATDGTVSAVLTGTTSTGVGGDPGLVNPRLRVTVGGRLLLDEVVVPSKALATSGFQVTQVIPWSIGPTSRSAAAAPTVPLCLARFTGSDLPAVLLGLDAGGAHCCLAVRAIPLGPTAAGAPVDIDLGNPGAAVEAYDGRAVIVTADNRFAYAFASYAASGMPVMVYEVGGGKFVDTTLRYPDLITQDATTWWNAFNDPQNAGNGLGLLAPWVADQCELGQSTHAWATVAQLNAQGKLTEPTGDTGPSGAAYVTALHAFLVKYGYC